MFDVEIIKEILKKLLWSIDQIQKRSIDIKEWEDFYKDDKGYEILDSICMQLINIGEAIKQIDKITSGKLLINYPVIDWKSAKGMRDIISQSSNQSFTNNQQPTTNQSILLAEACIYGMGKNRSKKQCKCSRNSKK